jgi:plastocyanin
MIAKQIWASRAGATRSRLSRAAFSISAVIVFGLATTATIFWPEGRVYAEEASVHPASKAITVKIDNFTFSPSSITIAPGTTVTWVNEDDIPHTIVESNRAFKSKVLDTDDSFSYTFSTPGEVDYFCSLHPHMTGKIIIKREDASS